jgi:diaminohydroxyphosphoribosylaminopyrimidine deaminase/5-amino-6-(5-phosphoribosylamino)uracil reductase
VSASTTDPARVDLDHMTVAIGLARRALGNAWPNPAVGCVIVRDGRVVGRGWTQPGGRPHAETEALVRAGDAARGATAYVSLEPCSHLGKTPPCADALIEAGVARVVVGQVDPDPRVAGSGLRRLRESGIEVVEGTGAAAAADVNRGFVARVTRNRPEVTLKLATSLDGQIATATGASKWITGPQARDFSHGLRLRHDAVLAGIGTVLADDPELTCRLPGGDVRPAIRVVLDNDGRFSTAGKLAQTAADIPVWLVLGAGAAVPDGLPAAVEAITVPRTPRRRPDLPAVMAALAERGVNRLLVEGGGLITAAMRRETLVDRIYWFRAGIAIGDGGTPGVADFGVSELAGAPRFAFERRWLLGGDVLESWVPAR